MSSGHGIIINTQSYAPFVFTYNPPKIESTKKINWAVAPNIGGASKKRYFSGFETKEVKFQLHCLDMESPTGVMEEIAFFEQLREPDGGPFMGFSLYGNVNFPPPQVLFQYGVSYIPLYWDVLDVQIEEDHFHSGKIRGPIGIPKQARIDITLALDEDSILNKANQIAKKAQMYAASAKSIAREVLHEKANTRKEMPGIYKKFPDKKWTGKMAKYQIDSRY